MKFSNLSMNIIFCVGPRATDEKKEKNRALKSSRQEMLTGQASAVDSPSERKGLNLSSTSVIIFEEVN